MPLPESTNDGETAAPDSIGGEDLLRLSTVDISHKPSPHSLGNRCLRALWHLVYLLLFRTSPRPLHAWRRWLLRLFGAKLGKNTKVFSSVKIWAPWQLHMQDHSTLAPDVDCYCVAPVFVGTHSTVSQYSYLCTASHDFEHPNMMLVSSPISIGDRVWIAADVFVGPGVSVGDNTVVGARSSVFADLPASKVCVGNPARPIRDRVVRMEEGP